MKRVLFLLILLALATGPATAQDGATVQVPVSGETGPTEEDGATAPIIWIHPTDTALSTVIGTDENGGLIVYDLSGEQLQFENVGSIKNADLRYNFPLGDERITLLTAGLEDDPTVLLYAINPETRLLESLGSFQSGVAINGVCMYRSPVDARFYTIVGSPDGELEQWALDGSSGEIVPSLERAISVGGEIEGCVADDELGKLYIGEETVAIWEYGAEPESGQNRQPVGLMAGLYEEEVEGLALYYADDGDGYIIGADQDGSRFHVYERAEGHEYLGAFEIVAANGVDGVDSPSGVRVVNVPLGDAFPQGLFVTSDDNNTDPTEPINFKLVSWGDIAAALDLIVDTDYFDPREVGAAVTEVASASIAVPAFAETAPVPSGIDAADDPAIWIHPTDPTRSTIIGTDKTGGLVVYDLATGDQIQYVAVGRVNNVDLRYNFPLNGERVSLVIASNRTENNLVIYRVDPENRQLRAAGTIQSGVREVYGLCMYVSPVDNTYYAIVNSTRDGGVEQWALSDAGDDTVAGELVRSFTVGTQTEGCVADDELGHLYIGEEAEGIWKYGAEPDAGEERIQVDTTAQGGNLTADTEGLAIYYGASGTGYLIASSQGSSEFVVYDRAGDNAYIGTFSVIAGGTADPVSGTDGLDVTNFPFGDLYPEGLFVAQDDLNIDPDDSQNFKLVSWGEIAAALGLTVDTSFDPRTIGAE